MIVEILSVDLRSRESIGIVAPSENPRIWDICRKQVTKPVKVIGGPSSLAVSIESMDSDDTLNESVSEAAMQRGLTREQDRCLPQGL